MVRRAWPFALALMLMLAAPAAAAPPFELADGDRIVLVGNTFIERDQTYGFLEAALTLRHPGRHLVFRNLGWSGDTVFGEARASFDAPSVGFDRLKEHVLALKPTVIVVGYGGVESFEGQAGLPRFREGLDTLLNALAESRARFVFLSPLRHEDLGRPLPDPAGHNEDLKMYRDAVKQAAAERKAPFIDLFDALEDGAKAKPPRPLTDNGLHPTAYGAWRVAEVIERGLGIAPVRWRVEIGPGDKDVKAEGTRLSALHVGADGVAFEALDATLPDPPCPFAYKESEPRVARIRGLAPGVYTLKIDGEKAAIADADAWSEGIDLALWRTKATGPFKLAEFEQVEALRLATIAKNRLYFHRWRPENETYLFGFRKHEQGKNAAEIVQFDPLIAEQESAIDRLATPTAHKYALIRAREAGR